MARSFDPIDLVMLPRTSAVSALGLLRATLSACEAAGRLPAPIEEARQEVQVQYDSLSEAVRGRGVLPVSDSPNLRVVDARLDTAWGGFVNWLTGFTRLPEGTPESEKATPILGRLFPEGLKFTLQSYPIEWGESESRLEAIKKEKLESVIVDLGGAVFLTEIRAAHKAYGEVLGITAATAADQARSTARVREALDEAMASMRTYVVRVSAHVRKNDQKTEQLAKALLAPVMTWKSTGSGREEDEPSAPAPANNPENQ